MRTSGLRRWAVAWALSVLALAFCVPAAAAEGGPGDLWQTFYANDGLVSGNVAAVLQARDGALWFGTDSGASRYDGVWRSFSEQDGLPAGRIRALAQTNDGVLWFGAQQGGVGRCEADLSRCAPPWTTAQGLPGNDVRALLPASNGHGLWIGTAKGVALLENERVTPEKALEGIAIWSLKAGPTGTLFAGTEGRGVWQRDADGIWQPLAEADGPASIVYALHVDQTGQIWAGTSEGLFVYQKGEWRQRLLIEGNERIRAFAIGQDRRGRIWVGTEEGLFYARDPRTPDVLDGWLSSQPGGLVNKFVRAFTFADDGSLWIGTYAGISRYDEETWQAIRDEVALGQRINVILMDSEGQAWAGTDWSGLLWWDGQNWHQLGPSNGLPDTRVIALYQDTKGRLWIGTGTGIGYRKSDGKLTFFGPASGIAGLPVYAIAQDNRGTLVFATQGGASRFDEQGRFTPITGLIGKRVNAVQRDAAGALWLGTEQDGIFKLVNDQLTPVTAADGAPSGSIVVNGIVLAPDGALWVATYDEGLWRLKDAKWERVEATLPTPRILALRYMDNNLWVGTLQGFSRFDGKTWQSYVGDGLPNLEILALAPGPAGSVWIGTGNGIVRYTPEKQAPWVKIESVNLIRPTEGRVRLTTDTLKEVQLRGGDLATRQNHLRYLTQLVDFDLEPQFYAEPQVSLGDRHLAPGVYRLRAWARDAALNYSPAAEVLIEVPRFVRLPGGYTVTQDVVIAISVLGLTAIGGLASAGRTSLRVRREARARAAAEAARRREALARHFNPYISGEPVRQADMFFGRDALLRKIVNALHQNSIMIHGERRMGKTTLLYQLGQALRQADDPEWSFIPVSIDLEGTPEDRFFFLLMDAIWGMLQAYLTATPLTLHYHRLTPNQYTDREFNTDLREIIEALKPIVAPRQLRIILLIDEMDAIDSYSRLTQLQL